MTEQAPRVQGIICNEALPRRAECVNGATQQEGSFVNEITTQRNSEVLDLSTT